MGFLFPKAQSTTDPRLNSMAINQSSYGNAIPLVYGRTRIPIFLLHYLDFKAIPHTQKSGGGKGGHGPTQTSFTYTAAIVMALCEGVIPGIASYWADKKRGSGGSGTLATDLNCTLFTGTGSQSPWSYLTTNHPTEAVPYSNIAYLASGAFDLGSSAALPNLSFEVDALCQYAPLSGFFDAAVVTMLTDYLTHPIHGANWPATAIDLTSQTGLNAIDNLDRYCVSSGFFLSPAEMTQRPAVEFLREICQIINADGVFSQGKLKIVPYCDVAVTGNTQTYTPDLQPIYRFGDGDYVHEQGEDPVDCSNKPSSETFNVVRVEFLDKDHEYNTNIAEAKDEEDIRNRGLRVMPTVTLHSITGMSLARYVAQLILQRQLYIRATFKFRVRSDYSLLEPMDLIAIDDSTQGIVNQLIRITSTEDPPDSEEDRGFSIEAEEMLVGPASAPRYDTQAAAGYTANYNAAPGSVQTPLIFVAPPYLSDVNGGYELCISTAGPSGSLWGGCDVHMSYNNTTYAYVGSMFGSSRYGTLRSTLATGTELDTTHTLQLQLADTTQQMQSGTTAEADNLATLMYVDGEVMAYRDASLVGSGQYDLSYLRRGKYGSSIAAHSSGTKWARFDRGVFRIPFSPGDIGKTIYVKLASFNIYGGGTESLGAISPYTYVLGNPAGGSVLAPSDLFVARGGTRINGTSFIKTGGVNSTWDSDAITKVGFAAAHIVAKANETTTYKMFGFTDSPTDPDISYVTLDYAFYFEASASAILIYESGTSQGTFATYDKSTTCAITYDGTTVRYYINDMVTPVRSVTNAGKTFYGKVALYSTGAGLNSVRFGPSAILPITDTGQIRPGAATGIVYAEDATSDHLTPGSPVNLLNFHCDPFDFDCRIIVTAVARMAQSSTSGALGVGLTPSASGPGNGFSPTDVDFVVGPNPGTTATQTLQRQFDVDAGEAPWIELYGFVVTGDIGACNYTDKTLQLEIIRR